MGCYVWYSEEGTGRGRSPPRLLLAVPNVTAHPSTASVPITVLLYDSPLFYGFNVPIKGLTVVSDSWESGDIFYWTAVSLSVDHCRGLSSLQPCIRGKRRTTIRRRNARTNISTISMPLTHALQPNYRDAERACTATGPSPSVQYPAENGHGQTNSSPADRQRSLPRWTDTQRSLSVDDWRHPVVAFLMATH